jgi:hypothetical protein
MSILLDDLEGVKRRLFHGSTGWVEQDQPFLPKSYPIPKAIPLSSGHTLSFKNTALHWNCQVLGRSYINLLFLE